jgi:hypothetical protein
MPCRTNIRQHATLVYPIDELSLGVAPDKHGRELELCVHAYGEAEIAYDRDGDWQIIGLQIDGMRRNLLAAPTWLKDVADLPKYHPLYPVIVAALESVSYQDIDDQVAKALADERESV